LWAFCGLSFVLVDKNFTTEAHLCQPIFGEGIDTFSGFNYTAPFLDLMLNVGVERIMFSADYPYASMAEARAFLEQLPVSPADKERIAHGNAERLLRL
jgi:predicted TIM-barrel fold metal-dependent hydrolase